MITMRVVQVSRPNGPFEIVERPIPDPGAGSVRIKVLACGICHSDSLTKGGTYKGWYSGTSIDSQDTLVFRACPIITSKVSRDAQRSATTTRSAARRG